MTKLRKCLLLLGAVAISCFGIQPSDKYPFSTPGFIFAQNDWKSDFEDICLHTKNAMDAAPDELNSLIRRCDKLKPVIEKLDETQRKVYLRRLQLCRDFFSFVLESKKGK